MILKNEIFRQYESLVIKDSIKRISTGDLMNRISEDVGKVRMYFGPAIMYSINMITLFVIVIGNMISINTKVDIIYIVTTTYSYRFLYTIISRVELYNTRSRIVQEYLSKLNHKRSRSIFWY